MAGQRTRDAEGDAGVSDLVGLSPGGLSNEPSRGADGHELHGEARERCHGGMLELRDLGSS